MKLVILTDWILDLLDVVRSCRSDYHLLAQWRSEFINFDIDTVIAQYLEKSPSVGSAYYDRRFIGSLQTKQTKIVQSSVQNLTLIQPF